MDTFYVLWYDIFTSMNVIFADTIDELRLKILGYNHDHCHHIYFGKTSEIMDEYKYKELLKENKEYCFIYKEDRPYG
jgi:hypothetical protein